MSLLWADGFDHYGSNPDRLLDRSYAEINGVTLPAGQSRTGPRNARVSVGVNNSGLRRVLPGDRSHVGCAFAFNLSELPRDSTSMALIQFLDAENRTMATLTVMATGAIQYRAGGRQGAVLATSTRPVVFAGSYQHFEIAGVFGEGSEVEVRIDSVTCLTGSGAVSGAAAQLMVGGCYGYPKSGSSLITMDIDDLVAWDGAGAVNNTFLGDKKCYTRFPDADGVEQDWTPAEGANAFPMLNNVPPQDATAYISTDTAGQKTAVGIAPFPTEIVSIAGVYTEARLWKTDAGSAQATVDLRADAVETASDPHPISTRPSWYGDVFEVDPSTEAPWLIEDLNDAEVILERTT